MVQFGHITPMTLRNHSDKDLSEVNKRDEKSERDHHEKQELLVETELSHVGQHVVEIHDSFVVLCWLTIGDLGWLLGPQVARQVSLRVYGHVTTEVCSTGMSELGAQSTGSGAGTVIRLYAREGDAFPPADQPQCNISGRRYVTWNKIRKEIIHFRESSYLVNNRTPVSNSKVITYLKKNFMNGLDISIFIIFL